MPNVTWRRPTIVLCALAVFACGGGGGGPQPVGSPTWTSELFPPAWTPSHEDSQGRYLPDVSYAGYGAGERDLPSQVGWRVVDVVSDHGADPTGTVDSTRAFQEALDGEPPLVVHAPAGLYRLDGVLTLRQSEVVLQGEGPSASRLCFTKHDGMTGRSHLTVQGSLATDGNALLAADALPRAFEVEVDDANGFRAGDDVVLGGTITEAFVAEHGMTGTWQAFNGTWQPFLRRRVVEVDTTTAPHRIRFDAPVRYPLRVRDGASVRRESGFVREVGIRDLGLANAVGWDQAWANVRVHVLALIGVKDGFVERVESFASPVAPVDGAGAGAHLQSGGILVQHARHVTIAACRMERAQHRGGGGCGYLFELLQATDVLTRDCEGRAGRHNFIQNWGFGTTGCVWLRCWSREGFAITSSQVPALGQVGFSEYHHSLATACLVDDCRLDDGWAAQNRHDWSSGAGHTATACVFWNVRGYGVLRSRQFGLGYVIGTEPPLRAQTSLTGTGAQGTEPEDYVEGLGRGASLRPRSLYEAQLAGRLGR